MSPLSEKIAAEVRLQGAIPFSRFMELALYCPVYGYYEKERDTIGRRGDYFTNVSVGSLFGELLAGQFAEWLEQSPKSKVSSFGNENRTDDLEQPVQIVEAGAHQGMLAADILSWLRSQRPRLFERLEYLIVEPSLRRQEWQRNTLATFSGRVLWVTDLEKLRAERQRRQGNSGNRLVIFCNELLDAMPARRFGWDATQHKWFEWGVGLKDEHFIWAKMPCTGPAGDLPGANAEWGGISSVLPDEFTLETCPPAEQWWRHAAECLEGEGKIVAIDYGLIDEEVLMPERRNGTLRAYRKHQLSSDVLAEPGEQDLTVHVNFGAVRRAGESMGLTTEALQFQSQFLSRRVGEQGSEWNADRIRQFQTLTHPEHLGHAFRVLIQSREAKANS